MRSYLTVLLLLALPAAGAATRAWEQSRFDEFEKGVAEHVSLRSDGKITIAPRFREIYDAPSAYLWALARDSKGNLYTGGGPDGRVFKIAPDGAKTRVFQSEALEIHALAVDRHDNVYAATSPDSKIYKIDPSGRSSLFLDPKVKYVWDMAFNSQGDLLLATGDKGEIFRVEPSGKSRLFFKSDESHIRSLLIDKNNDLIIGTDPGGLVIRVSGSDASGFVLYQSSKKEITALALGSDGSLYAAGVGTRARVAPPAPLPAAPVPTATPITATLGPGQRVQPSAPPLQPSPLQTALRAGVTGGSEVLRISPDGSPRKIWTSNDDIVYTLAFSPSGKLLIGTGNRGNIFQLESDHVYSLLLRAAPTQVTAFLQDRDGKLFVATGNVGKVYQLGPELETKGTFESEVFDAGMFSRWGRLNWKGEASQGAGLALYTRSGNLSTPAQYWSPWSAAITTPDGAPAGSPAARFVQWKAVLETQGTRSPQLDSVTLAYQPKNVAPTITDIEITPPNHRFPDAPLPSASSSRTLSLPALGSKPSPRPATTLLQSGRSMVHAKGYLGARWLAQDENEDELAYKVEIRGVNEKNWKLLGEDIDEPYLSWDSTAFADGLYQVRITASDSPSNPRSEALSYSKESEPFYIDNTPPAISRQAAAAEAGRLRARFHAADALTNIKKSEYSVDGSEWRLMLPATRLFDSRELDYDFLTDEVKPGEHTVAVRVWDGNDNLATAKVIVR